MTPKDSTIQQRHRSRMCEQAKMRLEQSLKLDQHYVTKVFDVMEQIPRHKFLNGSLSRHAYADTPIPIGEKQTISQPTVVALMTYLAVAYLDKRKAPSFKKVLEIGTGSGYQSAILSKFFTDVYSIERHNSLHITSSERLQKMHYSNVTTKHDDGFEGWEQHAPYNAIIITAALNTAAFSNKINNFEAIQKMCPKLFEQLGNFGCLIAPVGNSEENSSLLFISKPMGKLTCRSIMPVKFVPLIKGIA